VRFKGPTVFRASRHSLYDQTGALVIEGDRAERGTVRSFCGCRRAGSGAAKRVARGARHGVEPAGANGAVQIDPCLKGAIATV